MGSGLGGVESEPSTSCKQALLFEWSLIFFLIFSIFKSDHLAFLPWIIFFFSNTQKNPESSEGSPGPDWSQLGF